MQCIMNIGDVIAKQTISELGKNRYEQFKQYLQTFGYCNRSYGNIENANISNYLILADDGNLRWWMIQPTDTFSNRIIRLDEIMEVLTKHKTSHLHAENMKMYAEDAMISPEPWKMWQSRKLDSNIPYKDCVTHPHWLEEFEYRRKPKTVIIGDTEIDMPLRTAPKLGTKVYVVALTKSFLNIEIVWKGSDDQLSWLTRGIMHLKQESAIKHARALLKLI